MPLLPLRACPQPGCPEVTRGGGRCEKHSRQKREEYARMRRTPAKSYDRKWRKIREAYLTKNPLCVECLDNGRTKAAEMVHHVVPLDEGGTHKFENLMALCMGCHGTKHKKN